MADPDQVARLFGLLGLARRAGQLALGFGAVENLVHRGQRPLVILATDAGQTQRRRVTRLAPVAGFLFGAVDREQLAAQFGRQDLAVVGVADHSFVNGIQKLGLTIESAERT